VAFQKFLVLDRDDPNLPPAERLKLDRRHEKELTQLQRDYRLCASGRFAPKPNRILAANLEKIQNLLENEKKDLAARQNVASGAAHKREYEHQMQVSAAHIRCQETIQDRIDEYKVHIQQLTEQIERVDKAIVQINAENSSDYVFAEHVRTVKRRLQIFENRLSAANQRNNKLMAENKKLREVIENMLTDRGIFHTAWKRMIGQLSFDKKFLIDMIERALVAFHQSEEMRLKLAALRARAQQDRQIHVIDMVENRRKLQAIEKNGAFFCAKGKERPIADLPAKTYRERDQFRADHRRKIALYDQIIGNCKEFYAARSTMSVIELFQKQENDYFAHFIYMNEMNKQIAALDTTVQKCHRHIDGVRAMNADTREKRALTCQELAQELEREKQKTATQKAKLANCDAELDMYLECVDHTLGALNCDRSELGHLLGDHTQVTTDNCHRFLVILERKLNEVLSFVYDSQKRLNVPSDKQVVRGVAYELADPVAVEKVAAVQQCAECAEGEDVNRHDDEIVWPMSREMIKERLREKVEAPEMQYRLHSISNCKLPRSRIIANRKLQ
jgi:coiled-coil domain-containing protein 63/114